MEKWRSRIWIQMRYQIIMKWFNTNFVSLNWITRFNSLLQSKFNFVHFAEKKNNPSILIFTKAKKETELPFLAIWENTAFCLIIFCLKNKTRQNMSTACGITLVKYCWSYMTHLTPPWDGTGKNKNYFNKKIPKALKTIFFIANNKTSMKAKSYIDWIVERTVTARYNISHKLLL